MSFFEGLQLSVISMLITFVLLYVLALILGSFKYVFDDKKKQNNVVVKKEEIKKVETIGVTYEELEKDEDMLVATMVATMEANGENKNSNFKVTRVRQL